MFRTSLAFETVLQYAAGLKGQTRPACRTAASSPAFSVEVASAARFMELSAAWRDLANRAAEPNVFMEPAVISAAAGALGQDRVCVLLVWRREQDSSQLVGAWALKIRRGPASMLRGPVNSHLLLATPVLDAAYLEEALSALLDAVAATPDLPKRIRVRNLGDEGPIMAGLRRVLSKRGATLAVLERRRRAKLHSDLDGKSYLERSMSAKSRRTYRQRRKRLGQHGAVTVVEYRAPDAIRHAFEQFLTLEASGWKGQRGAALALDPSRAAFARQAFSSLAEAGLAEIHALQVNGQPAAMLTLLRSGAGCFGWKLAYDERLRDFSPGILLLEDLTVRLLADPGFSFADSCTDTECGYVADLWQERQAVAEVIFDARHGGSLSLSAAVAGMRAYRWLRQWNARRRAK